MDFKITRSLIYIPDSKRLRENFREMRIFHRRHPREVKSFTHRVSGRTNIRNALETGQENDSEPILLTAVQDADNVYGLPEAQSQDKNSLQGGGNKPISEGQVSAIHKCAAKRGLDPVKVARDMYGKSIDELVGWEADQCIKSFRNR